MATKADESEGITLNTAANIIDRIRVGFIVRLGLAGNDSKLLKAAGFSLSGPDHSS